MPYDPKIHRRRSIRLAGYDYTQCGAYFVTLNAREHGSIFGEVIEGAVRLSPIGEIVSHCWLNLANLFAIQLDAWVIMPDHLHGVIFLRGKDEAAGGRAPYEGMVSSPAASPLRPHGTSSESLGAVVQNFKSVTTRKINRLRGMSGGQVWQRNYYEHIVRNERELNAIRRYIDDNPCNWALDRENPKRIP